jgi:hypothetical protein
LEIWCGVASVGWAESPANLFKSTQKTAYKNQNGITDQPYAMFAAYPHLCDYFLQSICKNRKHEHQPSQAVKNKVHHFN